MASKKLDFKDLAHNALVIEPEAPKPGEALPDVINNPDVEKSWAIKAFQHAETYIKLITTVKDISKIRLTKYDDKIYSEFRKTFPTVDVAKVNEDEMKSPEGKKIWAPFMMSYEGLLDDFNFLTLLRLDASKDYLEDNTVVVPRIQWLCIEIARIREGHNRNILRS